MAAKIHIGTSGWHYRHWVGTFYPEELPASKMLAEYLTHFDTVELNNSFYRLPSRETFVQWKNSTPSEFLFAVKVSRFLTHNKKLKDPEEPLQNVLNAARGLGRKLGPLLFQLPPHWRANLERLEALLRILPKSRQCTFEFREMSWMSEEVYALLRKYNCAFCIYELEGFETPHVLTADFTYIRLHGPEGKYQGSYSDKKLREWAREIRKWKRTLNDIYVYFDNDEAGYAAFNALTLKRMLRQS